MLKEQKSNVFVLGLVSVLGILLVTPTAKADLDIEWICITSCKTHSDGVPEISPWQFEMWVYVVDPGILHHIDVTKPGDSIPFAIMYEEGSTPRWGDYDTTPELLHYSLITH